MLRLFNLRRNTLEKLDFQAEYQLQYYNSHTEAQGNTVPNSYTHAAPQVRYGGVAYRVNKWLEVGSYYTEYYADANNSHGAEMVTPSDAYQKDVALSLRFDPKPWWVIKVRDIASAAPHYCRTTPTTDKKRRSLVHAGFENYLQFLKRSVTKINQGN